MKQETETFLMGFVCGCLLTLLVMAVVLNYQIDHSKKEAIQHGAAFYNPTNANFQWKN